MNPRNNNFYEMRKADNMQIQQVAQKWVHGTNVRALRGLQGLLASIAVLMGVLRAVGGENGLDMGSGIASCIAILLLFSPALLWWNHQISKIKKRARKLIHGQFVLLSVEGGKAVVNRWNVFYVGFGTATLPDGSVRKNLEIPYKDARELERTRAEFPAYLVQIEGEKKPILIPR